MKTRIVLIVINIILSYGCINAQVSICSWNLENFGQSKSDAEIFFIANTIKKFDIVCLQEVVSGVGGAPAVARLQIALSRTGAQWDYSISDPTISSSYKTERYAFLWKTAKVKKSGNAWLEKKYNIEIDREPYLADFVYKGKLFTLVNFHAITKSKQPEREIKYFKFLPIEYPGKNLIFAGDFNCPQSHTVFIPLKNMGYKPILAGQKTSLKQECVNEECLASEFDNIFYDPAKVQFIQSGIIPFYESFSHLKDARKISDHVPVFFKCFIQ